MSAQPSWDDIEGRAFGLGRKEGRRLSLAKQRRPDSLVASARRIDVTDTKVAERFEQSRNSQTRKGQSDAWVMFDALSEIKAGARFKAKSLGKLRMFVGVVTDDSNEPVPIEQVQDSDVPGITRLAGPARDVLARMEEGGDIPTMLGQWGYLGFVPGEAWLVAWTDDEGEHFVQVATDNLRVTGRNQWALALSPSNDESTWMVLPDDTILVRTWNQHPRWPDLADSSVIGVLPLCETLLLYQGLTMGVARSRMNNGFGFVDAALVRAMPGDDEDEDEDEEGGDKAKRPTLADLQNFLEIGMRDPTDARAALPYLFTADLGDADYEPFKHYTFDRPFDETIDRRTESTLVRIGNSVDLPKEVLLGLADANHWTAWLIDDTTYRSYVAPDADEITRAWTKGYLLPELDERFASTPIPPDLRRRIRFWVDPESLVADPDETDKVFKAHEAIIISDQGARGRLGISETEAPSPEEWERRAVAKASAKSATSQDQGGDSQGTGGGDGSGSEPDTQGDTQSGDGGTEDVAASAIVAAAGATDWGRRWQQRDRELRMRLQTSADLAVRSALSRAGAKLRTKAIKASAMHEDVVRAVPNIDVAANLGPGVVAALGLEGQDLLDGSFDDLLQRFDDQVGRVQAATRRDLQRLGLNDEATGELEARQDEGRIRGKEVLLAALLSLAMSRLFDPSPAAPVSPTGDPIGEQDVPGSVPASVLRNALSQAGGASGEATPGGAVRLPDGTTAGQVATGPDVLAVLPQLGLRVAADVWVYGDEGGRTNNFGPHMDLDGITYDSATDERLGNSYGFPDTEYFYPGDHDGCQCDSAPVILDA